VPGAKGLPGLFQHAAGRPGVLGRHAGVVSVGHGCAAGLGVAVGVLFQVCGQVFVGFGDPAEPVGRAGVAVVPVGMANQAVIRATPGAARKRRAAKPFR
jgi:hypothetical protein